MSTSAVSPSLPGVPDRTRKDQFLKMVDNRKNEHVVLAVVSLAIVVISIIGLYHLEMTPIFAGLTIGLLAFPTTWCLKRVFEICRSNEKFEKRFDNAFGYIIGIGSILAFIVANVSGLVQGGTLYWTLTEGRFYWANMILGTLLFVGHTIDALEMKKVRQANEMLWRA